MAVAILFQSMLALSLAGTLSVSAGDILPLTASQKQNLGIVSEPVTAQATGPALTYPARVISAPAGVRVVAAAGEALVTQMYVQPGDHVKRGAPLITLSMPGLAEARNSLTQARLRAALAADQAAREEKLFAEGLIAESRLRASRSEAEAARAGQNAAQQAFAWLGAGRVHGGTLTLTAPFAGVVSESGVEAGQRVDAGMALVKLVDPSFLALEIPLSLEQARQVAVGQQVRVAEYGASGQVIALLPQLNAAQNVVARASLVDPKRLLRPGQSVQAALTGAPAPQGHVVPSAALVWKGTTPYVFVETAKGYAPTPVRVLRRDASEAEVTGLAAGVRVAVRGVAALKASWLGE